MITHQSNTISVFYYNTIMWHHRHPVTVIMWQVWHRWVTLFRDFLKFQKIFKSVKISVFVVWSECQFNVKNVYFEKSKFSKKFFKNSDTKKLLKKIFKKFVCLQPVDKQLAIKLQFWAYVPLCVILNYQITFFFRKDFRKFSIFFKR